MKKLKKNTFPLFILISRAGLIESIAQITQNQYKIFAIIVSINLSFFDKYVKLNYYCRIAISHSWITFVGRMSYFVYCVLKFLFMICYNAYMCSTVIIILFEKISSHFTSTTMSNSISSKTSVEQDDVVLIYACAKKTFGFNA